MDIDRIADCFSYHGSGILFWTVDREGNTWVLLTRRRMRSMLGDACTFAIPTGSVMEKEDSLSAAMRVAHDDVGINTDRNKAMMFWNVKEGNVSLALYSYRVPSAFRAKCSGNYSVGEWFLLSPDNSIEDSDYLTREELRVFTESIEEKKAAV